MTKKHHATGEHVLTYWFEVNAAVRKQTGYSRAGIGANVSSQAWVQKWPAGDCRDGDYVPAATWAAVAWRA